MKFIWTWGVSLLRWLLSKERAIANRIGSKAAELKEKLVADAPPELSDPIDLLKPTTRKLTL